MRVFLLTYVLLIAVGCSRPHGEPTSAAIEAVTANSRRAGDVNPPSEVATTSTREARRPPFKAVPRPVPAIDRVMIISIDGLRPDLLLRAEMPRVRSLGKSGSFSFWAETTPEVYTLPSHVSMLTAPPRKSMASPGTITSRSRIPTSRRCSRSPSRPATQRPWPPAR